VGSDFHCLRGFTFLSFPVQLACEVFFSRLNDLLSVIQGASLEALHALADVALCLSLDRTIGPKQKHCGETNW
jgi:hypothetical protein